MNKINKLIALSAFVLICFSSCLKDKDYVDQKVGLDLSNSPKIVQILEGPEKDVVYNVSTSPLTEKMFTVNTGANVDKDLSVTLVMDNALATTAGYTILASSNYTLGSLTVVIPKGSNSVTIPLTIANTASLLGTSNALGFKIGSISDASYTVSANYKEIVCPIVVQNEYAGMYNVTGARYNYTGNISYSYPGPVPAGFGLVALAPTKELFTVNATTSQIGVAGLVTLGYSYIITVPPGSTGNTDIVCPTTFTPLFLSDNSGIQLKLSTYNPATKTFKVVLKYTNGSGNDRIMIETFVKQ